MKNFIEMGDAWTVTAPATIVSGQFLLIGTKWGVAVGDAASGAPAVLNRKGVFEIAKVSAQAWTVGAAIYWDDTAKNMTTTVGSNTLVGFAWEAAANPSSVGRVCIG